MVVIVKISADTLFSSSNEWGIPDLDISMCPVSLPVPFLPWGCQGRAKRMLGTWHFYIDDLKFNSLWNNPLPVLLANPLCAVEPNWTITADDPRSVALYQIYRKRYLSCFWQSQGMLTMVDLNVHERYEDLNLLGIPAGWRAFCTRGSWDLGRLVHHYAIAKSICDSEKPLFVVYAGGKDVELLCMQYGWYYFPTYRGPDSYRGVVNGGVEISLPT